jgi:hypothetical protein
LLGSGSKGHWLSHCYRNRRRTSVNAAHCRLNDFDKPERQSGSTGQAPESIDHCAGARSALF